MPSELNIQATPGERTGKGSRLKQIRKQHGLTQEEMAEHFSVSARSYRRWETESSPWPVSLIEALHERFTVDPTWLLCGTQPDNAGRNHVAVELLTAIDRSLVQLGMTVGTESLRRLLFQDFLGAMEGRALPDARTLDASIRSVGKAYAKRDLP